MVAAPTTLADGPTYRVGAQPDGSVITSTNQRLTPAGRQVAIDSSRPVAIAISPDGKSVAALNAGGVAGFEVGAVDLGTGSVTGYDAGGASGSFDGIAFSPDGGKLYTSDAGGSIHITSLASGGTTTISLPSGPHGNPSPGGMALSADGATMYVALNRSNTVGVVDLASGTLTREVPVGNAPHSAVLQGGLLYVTDEAGHRPAAGERTNDSSGTKVVADPYHGATASGAVSVVDVSAGRVLREIEVGLHPTALLASGGALYVANTNSDSVSVIDLGSGRVSATIAVTPFPGLPTGSAPTALAMLPGDILAVALGRDNAVALYAVGSRPAAFLGLVPTGWYPAALAVDTKNSRLVVANDKGVGSLAVSSRDPSAHAPRMVQEYIGSLSLVPFPKPQDLAAGIARVAANNGWDHLDSACPSSTAAPVAVPAHVGEPSAINHVFFVIKENRTYDQVMGDDTRGNGDPAEATFGQAITPNQHALAKQFGLFDNFYDSGSLSADGHQWVVQANSPDYLEKAFGSFPRSYPAMGFDAMAYMQGGFLWEDATRHGKTVTNFAEYALEGGQLPEYSDIPSNDANIVRDYPGFALNIPDQQRADIFLRHFDQYVRAGRLANLTFIRLPDDHTGGTNPKFPSPAAEVADNDMALGRILDAISHSPFWKDSAVFMEEDDSQAGTDHVDGHRSTFFLASPYARRGVIDSTYYTQVNVVRTIEQILGLPAMNQMDMAAVPMRDAFTDKPDLAPFSLVDNQLGHGGPLAANPPLSQLTGLAREWAQAATQQDFAHTDAANPAFLNRDVWYSVKGFATPYPGDSRVLHPWEVPGLGVKVADAGDGQGAVPAAPVAPPPAAAPSRNGIRLDGPAESSAAAACTWVMTALAPPRTGGQSPLPNTGRPVPVSVAATLLALVAAVAAGALRWHRWGTGEAPFL
jgi:YVTN family beta-propeller protein